MNVKKVEIITRQWQKELQINDLIIHKESFLIWRVVKKIKRGYKIQNIIHTTWLRTLYIAGLEPKNFESNNYKNIWKVDGKYRIIRDIGHPFFKEDW